MINKILKSLRPVLTLLKRYGVILAIVGVAAVYGCLIFTSDKLANVEPDDAKISENYKGAKKPKMEDSFAAKLHELEDRNVQFKALMDEARQNPFVE